MAIDRDRPANGTARFADAAQPPPDQVDVVLAEWSNDRPHADLEPIAVTARVSRLAQILQQRIERTSTRFGLDWGQFLALTALRGSGPPYRMSPRELHRLLLLSPAGVTNRLYRLEAKGLIERIVDRMDRRSLPVVLTPLGLSTIERAMAACVEDERGLLAALDPRDAEATLRSLRQFLAAYEDYPTRRSSRHNLALAAEAIGPELAEAIGQAESSAAPSSDAGAEPQVSWPDSHRDLERLQRKLARRADEGAPWVWTGAEPPALGGVFVSLPTGKNEDLRDLAWAAAIVMEGSSVVATATATRRLERAYQPGYLALAIGPVLEDIVRALSHRPDIIVVNAAGRDHPRGAGLAIQLGAALEIPTVGVTERPLVGVSPEPGGRRGDWTPVRVDNRLVGFRVRTLSRAKAITAHAAWRTTAEVSRDIVLGATARSRVPEPIQLARQLARRLRTEHERSTTGTGLQDGIHG
jgi:deoxyribonuclease V